MDDLVKKHTFCATSIFLLLTLSRAYFRSIIYEFLQIFASSITYTIHARVALWDNLKFGLIFFVVLGHFVEGYVESSHMMRSTFIFIYSFHMPLFLFVSGLFAKSTDSGQKLVVKVFTLWGLGFFAKVICAACGASLSIFSDAGIPWFLFVLGTYHLLLYLLRPIRPSYLIVGSILLACISGYDTSIGDFLYVSRTIVFLPFFLCGHFIDRERLLHFLHRKGVRLAAMAILVLFAWYCYRYDNVIYQLRYLFTGRNPFINRAGALLRCLCYAISSIIGIAWIAVIPARRLAVVTRAGRNTLAVYVWHLLLLSLYHSLGIHLLLMETFGRWWIVIHVLCALAVTLFLSADFISAPFRAFQNNAAIRSTTDTKRVNDG